MPKMIAVRPLTGYRSDQRPHLITVPPGDSFDCCDSEANYLAARGLAEFYVPPLPPLPPPPPVVIRKPLATEPVKAAKPQPRPARRKR